MRLISFVFLLGCACSVDAQITAVLNQPGNRTPEVEIRNDSGVGLSAFAITMAPTDADGPFVFFVDAAVDPGPMPLLPNQKYSVPIPSRYRRGQAPEALYGPPIVTAGVLADGTTTGDAALLARLVLRRCNMLQAVELARDMLSEAGKHNVPRPQLVGQFQQLADSLNHWYLPPEQQVGRGVYQGIVGKLMGLPDTPFGSAFPPTAFVEREVAALSRQRTALLESQPGLAGAVAMRR